MKLIKTVFLTTLAVGGLLACVSAPAQDSTNMPAASFTNAPPRHMTPRGPSIGYLVRALNLTDEQKAKVQPIMDEQFQKMQQLREDFQDGTVTRDQIMAKREEIREATTAQLKSVLTDQQFQKWEMMSQHRRPPMMRPPGVTNGAAASAP